MKLESCKAKGRQHAVADRLKARRKELGLSINQLAKDAGVAKSNLARMEAGEGNPSLETVWALSDALGMNVSALLEPTSPNPRILEAGRHVDIEASESDFSVQVLSTCPAGASRDIYKARVSPGRSRKADPHPPGTIEHVVVLSGSISIGPEGSAVTLQPGDYMSFRADERHEYEARETDAEIIIVIECPAS